VDFLKKLALYSLIIGLLIGGLQFYTGNQLVHNHVWWLFGFMVLVTALTFYVSRLGVSYDSDNFQLYYFGSMGFRMILSIALIFIYVFMFSENELQFVLNFFVLYFLFTGFEIYSLLANFAPQLKKQDEV
jgi:hypothetical protein